MAKEKSELIFNMVNDLNNLNNNEKGIVTMSCILKMAGVISEEEVKDYLRYKLIEYRRTKNNINKDIFIEEEQEQEQEQEQTYSEEVIKKKTE